MELDLGVDLDDQASKQASSMQASPRQASPMTMASPIQTIQPEQKKKL